MTAIPLAFSEQADSAADLGAEMASLLRGAARHMLHSAGADAELHQLAERYDAESEMWKYLDSLDSLEAVVETASTVVVTPSTASPTFLAGARHAALRATLAARRLMSPPTPVGATSTP